ncbi:Sulfatase [Novipirellula aureliae]|uniref:Sulfatase n=1 Tax=Novipirellula aureliae TaxID=2527966 RepID=A0A5C6D8Z3_9BACT|nr:sulfatase-like hydrolase/transferase [Novipirellula aureliae]TWU33613.1 Sulfatase [Novipirellula aureliae]
MFRQLMIRMHLASLLLITTTAIAVAGDRPNILWLTSEDNNVNWVGCYGNPYAETPHIDELAREGFQYMNCYSDTPVCAPQRCTWITGVYALSLGTHPMRSRYPIPHESIKYYPDHLKAAGYFVGNSTKTDYNIGGRKDSSPWDTKKVDWQSLKNNQPFMMVINTTKSHESKAFGDIDQTEHDPQQVRLAKYHPDIADIRKNYAHYHDQVKKMDADIGDALAKLEQSGMADNTIVIYNSDHGGVLPRSKRFLYNSGIHCPLIIRVPEKFKHLRPAEPGTKIEDLVSFIDMPKTWLQICGIDPPRAMQGKVFLGDKKEPRDYQFSFRGRMDERIDNIRSVRDKRFLYIRNYMPYAPWGHHQDYLWNMKATQAWEAYHREGKTDAVTGRFFQTKPMEELYDMVADPDNVDNLIADPEYGEEVKRLSAQLDQWQLEIFDAGLLPESEVVRRSLDCGKTIYEMVRDPSLYDIAAYQNAAALALEQDPANLSVFYNNLNDEDAGVRYWAIVGCFNLQGRTPLDPVILHSALRDPSHHVRIMAAWTVYKEGDKAAAQACWNDLLENDSYAALMVLNVLDWTGDGFDPHIESIKACKTDMGGNVERIRKCILNGEM